MKKNRKKIQHNKMLNMKTEKLNPIQVETHEMSNRIKNLRGLNDATIAEDIKTKNFIIHMCNYCAGLFNIYVCVCTWLFGH